MSAGDGEAGGEEEFVVDLDEQFVFAGAGEGEVADFVDEIDAVEGALGLEGAVEERLGLGALKAHGDLEGVLAGRDVAEGEEPDHERVRDGELPRLNVREDAENGVFAGAGVDVDAVTGKPGEKLWFGLHEGGAGRGGRRGANHFAWRSGAGAAS